MRYPRSGQSYRTGRHIVAYPESAVNRKYDSAPGYARRTVEASEAANFPSIRNGRGAFDTSRRLVSKHDIAEKVLIAKGWEEDLKNRDLVELYTLPYGADRDSGFTDIGRIGYDESNMHQLSKPLMSHEKALLQEVMQERMLMSHPGGRNARLDYLRVDPEDRLADELYTEDIIDNPRKYYRETPRHPNIYISAKLQRGDSDGTYRTILPNLAPVPAIPQYVDDFHENLGEASFRELKATGRTFAGEWDHDSGARQKRSLMYGGHF
jgi:hypothetical protein